MMKQFELIHKKREPGGMEHRDKGKELQKSLAEYEAIIKAFDGLIYICSQDYRVEFMNDRFIERTGYDPLGQECYKALHNLDSICPWCVNEKVLRGETVRWEVLSPKDNRWYYVVNTPIHRPDGRISKMAMIQDITESKRIDEALRESEKRYRALFEESRDAIYVSTRDGKIMDVNQSASALFGYTREEMTGLNILELYVRPEDRFKFREKMEQEGFVTDYELKLRKKDGTAMECLVTSTARRANDGSIWGDQGIIRDITERKKAEEEIRRLNRDLMRRTLELETANKELESFSYSVTHDLRTPLLIMGGFSRTLLERYSEHLDVKGQEFLNIIQSNAQSMLRLIDDLLTFSRLDRQELECSNIDMCQLAQTVCNELKLIYPSQRCQVNIGDLPAAIGDPTMIRQVFVNVLSNALKFTRLRENGIIEIGCIGKEHENVYYVKDNGVGFDMKDAGKLFGVFQRLHASEEFEGTGVGLAIVQRIIKRHRGWVWAEGRVNEGAAFYFSLPKRT